MKDLASLLAVFSELDDFLVRQLSPDADANDVARTGRKQRLNEQAYFVVFWGQLENELDEACRTTIRKRQNDPDWEKRRGFDLYNPDDKRLSGLSFEDRVALILDRGGGRGSPWARVLQYYALRNQIAHGTLRSDQIDLGAVASDFYRIQAAISR